MRDPKDFNHLVGLDTELAEATFKCIGVPIEFKVGAWSGQLPAVANGQTDAMWDTLYYTPERAQQMNFVIYFRAATGGLVAKGNPEEASPGSTTSAASAPPAGCSGSVEEKQFHKLSDKCVAAGKPAIEVVVASDIPAGYRPVMNDRADLFLINLGLVDQMVAENPDKLERAFMILTDYKVGVGLNKQSAELGQAIMDASPPSAPTARKRRSTTSTTSTTAGAAFEILTSSFRPCSPLGDPPQGWIRNARAGASAVAVPPAVNLFEAAQVIRSTTFPLRHRAVPLARALLAAVEISALAMVGGVGSSASGSR